MECWADVFRCLGSPAARLNPKRLHLGIDFEVEMITPLAEDHGTLKAVREALEKDRETSI